MLNIFLDNLETEKLEYKSATKMSLQSGWIREDNKTNINLGAFLLSEKILETNYYPPKGTLEILQSCFLFSISGTELTAPQRR